jgi:tetratricopeptide (TPR) repeat protein
MRIEACLIVKDDSELKSLKRAYSSFMRYVDDTHIVANGKKVQGIAKWCKENKIHYYYLKWNKDFSEQRNFVFSKASQNTDYIFWMDADDFLIGGEMLRQVARLGLDNHMDCVYFTYWYACRFKGEPSPENMVEVEVKQMRERLINPRKMVWSKRIHETPVEIPGVKFHHTAYPYDPEQRPMVILHLGAHRSESPEVTLNRLHRNKEMLELELLDERAYGKPDPRTILYLMKNLPELDDKKQWIRCIELGKEYLQLSGWDEERATCNVLMAHCYSLLGDHQKSYEILFDALKEYPKRIDIHLRIAEQCYFLKKNVEFDFWLNESLTMDEEKTTSSADSIMENKILSAELTLRLMDEVKNDRRKSAKAAEYCYEINPNEINKERAEKFAYYADLDIACEHVDKLCQWMVANGDKKDVLRLLQIVPQTISLQPFAIRIFQKYAQPRIWEKNEICYYANFNQAAFEPWGPSKLSTGLGGSETAVVELSRQWVKMGYKVFIYGDPGEDRGNIDGVYYLPWYAFNIKDKFNIFIQWRSGYLAQMVSSKKFYVDLHDVWHPNDYNNLLESIDGIFVKSNYHRQFGRGIPDSKFNIISNGIEV